jgi:hypothetical protein
LGQFLPQSDDFFNFQGNDRISLIVPAADDVAQPEEGNFGVYCSGLMKPDTNIGGRDNGNSAAINNLRSFVSSIAF